MFMQNSAHELKEEASPEIKVGHRCSFTLLLDVVRAAAPYLSGVKVF
jgi:hypothetical protein